MHSLTKEQLEEIRRIRSDRVELDPGMGGVIPSKIREWINQGIKVTPFDFMLTKRYNFKYTCCVASSGPFQAEHLSFDSIEMTVKPAAELGTNFLF